MSIPIPEGSVVVSCQAEADSPLDHPDAIARIAQAVADGGASALRVNAPAHVAAVRQRIPAVPIIGIHKVDTPGTPIRITPTVEDAEALVRAGCDVVAVDATDRPRPGFPSLEALITGIRQLGVPVLADVDTPLAARRAVEVGADFVATTLAGYTSSRPMTHGPDLSLIAETKCHVEVPVVAEGRFREQSDVRQAFALGAHAVVIGASITDPRELTKRLLVSS